MFDPMNPQLRPKEEKEIEEFAKENLAIPLEKWLAIFALFCLFGVVFFA